MCTRVLSFVYRYLQRSEKSFASDRAGVIGAREPADEAVGNRPCVL